MRTTAMNILLALDSGRLTVDEAERLLRAAAVRPARCPRRTERPDTIAAALPVLASYFENTTPRPAL